MPDPKPNPRGRPSTGAALSGAERQRRYRERQKRRMAVTHTARHDKPPRANPDHQRLFAIPQGEPSCCTDLATRALPTAQRVTGDAEVDACLWLAEVCKTAQDLQVLELALEAARRIRRPAKEIEAHYAAWLERQPGVHPLQVAFGSLGVAEISPKVERARARIRGNAEGMAVFGSVDAAMAPTAAERMLDDTAEAWPEEADAWSLTAEQGAVLFAGSANPVTLTEVVNELRYWDWLWQIRDHMHATAHPGDCAPDDSALVSARRQFIEQQLLALAPLDHAEALLVADALQAGLIDIGSTDDAKRRARILDHLLRSTP